MRTFSPKIPIFLAFALAATQAFAHAQLEKSTPPVGGTVASASEIRLEFSEGVEPKFTKVTLTGPGGAARASGIGDNGSRQPGGADRADRETAFRRRLHGALAGGLGRHAPYPGNLRVHREAVTLRRAPTRASQAS